MGDARVSMTELRSRLGELVNRAAYGGERILLLSRGEPRAAIVPIADVRQAASRGPGDAPASGVAEATPEYAGDVDPLAVADEVRDRIRHWQEAHGVEPEDAVVTLRSLRDRRDE